MSGRVTMLQRMASRAPANARPAERFAVWGRAVGTSVLIVLTLLWGIVALSTALDVNLAWAIVLLRPAHRHPFQEAAA